jgi:hypothetical protein
MTCRTPQHTSRVTHGSADLERTILAAAVLVPSQAGSPLLPLTVQSRGPRLSRSSIRQELGLVKKRNAARSQLIRLMFHIPVKIARTVAKHRGERLSRSEDPERFERDSPAPGPRAPQASTRGGNDERVIGPFKRRRRPLVCPQVDLMATTSTTHYPHRNRAQLEVHRPR